MAGKKMPVIFVGHGSPENAIEDNIFTRNWEALAKAIPKPKAIISVSAHWLEEGRTSALAVPKPRTIYDFYGFQKELYEMTYGAEGAPKLADEICGMVKTVKVGRNLSWGLDHGTWIVLARMYPKADVPVLQLSIDYDLDPGKHLEIGGELAGLREKGVLIMASGNLVHNLREIDFDAEPYPWAVGFDRFVKENLEDGNTDALVDFRKNRYAERAHPTYDHYLPLLYALGAAEGEMPQFLNEGIIAGSISMRCAVFGAEKLRAEKLAKAAGKMKRAWDPVSSNI